MTQPEADTLFFAGEHTDITGNWGTVHAAIRSGLRAAAQILKEREATWQRNVWIASRRYAMPSEICSAVTQLQPSRQTCAALPIDLCSPSCAFHCSAACAQGPAPDASGVPDTHEAHSADTADLPDAPRVQGSPSPRPTTPRPRPGSLTSRLLPIHRRRFPISPDQSALVDASHFRPRRQARSRLHRTLPVARPHLAERRVQHRRK